MCTCGYLIGDVILNASEVKTTNGITNRSWLTSFHMPNLNQNVFPYRSRIHLRDHHHSRFFTYWKKCIFLSCRLYSIVLVCECVQRLTARSIARFVSSVRNHCTDGSEVVTIVTKCMLLRGVSWYDNAWLMNSEKIHYFLQLDTCIRTLAETHLSLKGVECNAMINASCPETRSFALSVSYLRVPCSHFSRMLLHTLIKHVCAQYQPMSNCFLRCDSFCILNANATRGTRVRI